MALLKYLLNSYLFFFRKKKKPEQLFYSYFIFLKKLFTINVNVFWKMQHRLVVPCHNGFCSFSSFPFNYCQALLSPNGRPQKQSDGSFFQESGVLSSSEGGERGADAKMGVKCWLERERERESKRFSKDIYSLAIIKLLTTSDQERLLKWDDNCYISKD